MFEEQKSWADSTDCDRLEAAFETLNRQGIVALEVPGLTQDDGIPSAAHIAVVRNELGEPKNHGYCFFT